MKRLKKFLSIVLTLCMVLTLLPMTVLAAVAPVVIGTVGYGTLTAALAAAVDGDVIKLNDNITESVSYAVYADKTVTIDGGGFKLTALSTASTNALTLSGAGTFILKNLTLQGGDGDSIIGVSKGMDVSGSVSVQSYGTVSASGGSAGSSYGLVNNGTGTVDVTVASATGGQWGSGAYNTGSGTINVGTATGSGAMNGAGAYNVAGGTINVTMATGSRNGVGNVGGGTINVTTAISTDAVLGGSAIYNMSTGTVNAGAADGAKCGVVNMTGTVNAGTITGTTSSGSGAVNTGAAVIAIPLHVGTGASCVLNSITIAKDPSGTTQIGTLPDVYKDGAYSTQWYTGIALTNLFTMQEISGEATLYSSFYTIETAEDLAAYITEVSGLMASVNGSTVTVTGTATVTSTNNAALTFEIPSGVKVVWKAVLSGGGSKYLLEPTGDGTFEVAAGANIVNNACQIAIYCNDGKGTLLITGGTVSTTGSGVVIGVASSWFVTMTGGDVSANADNSCAIFCKNNSAVFSGGIVSANGTGSYQLYMSGTSVYRSGILNTGKIMYHTSGVFAEVCVDTAVTQAQQDTSTGLTVTGHNLTAGDSMSAVWAKQNGENGVNISYYSARNATLAAEKWFLAVPGVTVTDTGSPVDTIPPTVTFVTPSGIDAVINGNIAITFSEPMNTVSGAVYISSDGGGSYGSALTGGSWSVSNSVYTVPYSGLSYSKTYSIKAEGFKDIAGNLMSMDTSHSFTTVAKPSTGSDNSGGTVGNGGGSTTPVTPTYNADVNAGSGSYPTLPVTVDKKSGSAGVDVGSGNGLMSDGKTTVITVPSVPDVDTYMLGIPVSCLSTANAQGALTFNTDTGSVTIPSNMLTGVSGISGNKVLISIGKGDKTALSGDVKSAIGNRPLVQLTLSIDGKQTNWTNPNAAVTVSIPYTPTAEELTNPESIVIWYIDGSGKVVSVPNGHYDPAVKAVTFSTTHFSNYAVIYNKVSFNDVPADAWYNKAVNFIAAREITKGTDHGNYSPEATLTRGEFIVMMMRAYGIAPDESPKDNFSDADSTYYTDYLAAAKRLGISGGVGNNMFAPDKAITRQEMFTLLYNALKVIDRLPQGNSGKSLSSFSDAGQIASWAKDAMTLLVETGTIGGNDGNLAPTNTTTRAEMAQVLHNLLGR